MKFVAIDLETVGLKPYGGTIWMLSITEGKRTKVLHDCNGKVVYFKDYKKLLEDRNVCKIVHNAEFDLAYIELNTGIRVRNIWDTQLCETVIQGTQIPRGSKDENLKVLHGTSLKHTLARYQFPVPDKTVRENFIARPKGIPFTKSEIKYAEGDTKFLPPLQQAQEYLLTRDGGIETALLENKVVEVVAQLKVRGLGVDVALWNRIADANLAKYNQLLRQLPPIENWNSPKQVKEFFYREGVLIESFSDLDKAYQQTKNKFLGQFIQARNLYSDATAYGRKWLLDDEGRSYVDPDGRMRVSWQQIINTGRFATSPNLLALPKEGSQRSAIVPAKGCSFIIGDYTGQEIGIMAAASKEDLWIDALLRGDDVHSLTASLIFSSEWQRGAEKKCSFPSKCNCKAHGVLRQQAKIINFMLAYGGGPKKFAEKTGCDELTARVVVNRHKQVIRKLTRYLDTNARTAVKTGVAYSADPYKRRIILKGQEEWQIANQGKNYPIQSAGANMLKLAMISMPEEYPIVLPFHDELVLEVPIKHAKKAASVMKEVMERSAAYITGIKGIIKVDPRIAPNFAKI